MKCKICAVLISMIVVLVASMFIGSLFVVLVGCQTLSQVINYGG